MDTDTKSVDSGCCKDLEDRQKLDLLLGLLSSLASDLDLMLRSAPAVRFTSTARLQLVRHDRLESRVAGGDDLQALLPPCNRNNRQLGNINNNLTRSRCSLSSDPHSLTPTSDLDGGAFAAGETSDSDSLLPDTRPGLPDPRPALPDPRPGLPEPRPSPSDPRPGLPDPKPKPTWGPSQDHKDGSGFGEDIQDNGEDEEGSYGAPCGLGLLERLLRSHPVWFLPGIQRAGAVHLLQGKEEGNFVVRGSSQPTTMAVSVRLPAGRGPYIEHYLVRASAGRVGLETSANRFDSIPELVAHYAQCCDELPVQLTLPRALREARNRQQLSSLALLGQEFWRHPSAACNTTQHDTGHDATRHDTARHGAGTLSDTNSSSSGSEYVSENGNQATGTLDSSTRYSPSPPLDLVTSRPLVRAALLTTFKGPRAPRPTPPSTLNLNNVNAVQNGFDRIPARTPPVPPPRWSKSATPASPHELPQDIKAPSPLQRTFLENNQVPTLSKRLSPEGECFSSCTADSTSLVGSSMRIHKSRLNAPLNVTSPSNGVTSPLGGVTSPTVVTSGGRQRRGAKAARKASRHYQESDILESPSVYCRSRPGDKASDYEDVWGPPDPAVIAQRRPDLLSDHTPNSITSLNGNLLSPDSISTSGSSASSGTRQPSQPNSGKPSSPPLVTSNDVEADNGDRLRPDTPNLVTANAATETEKQSPGGGHSPFYAEPADSIIQQQIVLRRPRGTGMGLRHSEPSSGSSSLYGRSPGGFLVGGALQRIDSSEELSSCNLAGATAGGVNGGTAPQLPLLWGGSVDDLQRRSRRRRKVDAWTVDSSWEFVARGQLDHGSSPFDMALCETEWSRIGFPTESNDDDDLLDKPKGPRITVREMIAKRLPDLGLPEPIISSTSMTEESSRMSAYDNVEGRILPGPALSSRESDDGTVFSEPWDCSRWQGLLVTNNNSTNSNNNDNSTTTNDVSQPQPQKRLATVGRNRPALERPCAMYVSSPRTAAPLGSPADSREAPGARVRRYALQLARDKSTTFAQNVDHFIACTRDGRERQPHVVMRNMRQFMSGMKNYLLKHGERGFEREVQLARARLRGDEFLNLDAMLEAVMQRLVAVPLRHHLYELFVERAAASGDLRLMAENIKLAAEFEPRELGLRACVTPPSGAAMALIAEQLTLLQEAESPLDKLDRLLRAVALVFEGTGGIKVVSADDFLPLLILVIARCGLVGAEIESELMWGLLQPSLLSGEAGYYLTALSSAVHVLKSLGAGTSGSKDQMRADSSAPNNGTNTAMDTNGAERPTRGLLPSCCGSLLRVVVPDEQQGSLQTRTLPVRPHTTAREVCRIIAHRARVTNPQDYGLFKLVDGEESLLADGDCPQEARLSAEGKHCVLAYKRIDAKIAWPTAALVTEENDC